MIDPAKPGLQSLSISVFLLTFSLLLIFRRAAGVAARITFLFIFHFFIFLLCSFYCSFLLNMKMIPKLFNIIGAWRVN